MYLMLEAILTFSSLLMSCSSDDDRRTSDGKSYFTLSVTMQTDDSSLQSRGRLDDTSDKDCYIHDLTVYVFDQNGDLIGHDKSKTYKDDNTLMVTIESRKATGCTVYAVANVAALGKNLTGIATKADFDAQYLVFKNASEQENATSLLMFGSLSNFDTTSSGGSIELERLVSKFDFTINASTDTESGLPITIDSYQLCHVPMASYLLPSKAQDFLPNVVVPADLYADYAEQKNPSSLNYTVYVYGNPVGKSSSTLTSWKERYAANAPENASYLVVTAHTAVWKSTYYIYLGGENLKADDSSVIYDYSDFTIYNNKHYSVSINIAGSAAAEDGYRVKCNVLPRFSVISLNPWGNDEERII